MASARMNLLVPFAAWFAVSCASGESAFGQPPPSVEVRANTFIAADEVGARPEPLAVSIRHFRRADVEYVSLRVRVRGADVTARLSALHRTEYDYSEPGDPTRILERLDIFDVNLAAARPAVSDLITYEVSVGGPGGQYVATGSTMVIMSEPPPDPCVVACVCAFVAALGTSKDPTTGKVTFSPGLNGKAIADAEATLRECLADCVPPQNSINSKVFECPNPADPNGPKLRIKMDMRGDNGSTGLDSSVTGAYDVTIAIAGNACSTCTMDGGAAKSTNTQAGGASLAVGGNGGDHDQGSPPGSPGNGGNATSSSSASGGGGGSVAVGGNGGNCPGAGGDGGNGSATTTGVGSTAYGEGGNGGDPRNDPPTPTTGGKGGNGTAVRSGNSATGVGAGQPGSPNPLEPGYHGEGGWARNTPSGATTHTGVRLANQ